MRGSTSIKQIVCCRRYSLQPSRACARRESMKTLLLITDVWHPQINGVVVAIQTMKEILERRNFTVIVVHPRMFFNFPLPSYPEIRVGLFLTRKLRRIVAAASPDFIHIATEGPLGLAGRLLCKRQGLLYTTAYHTHFQLYVHVRFRKFLGLVYGLLCWFHKDAQQTMVATPGLKNALEAHNFHHLTLWPLGVDTSKLCPQYLAATPSPCRNRCSLILVVLPRRKIQKSSCACLCLGQSL